MSAYTLTSDIINARKQALKLTKYGSLEGRYPVRVDKRTVVYKKLLTKS